MKLTIDPQSVMSHFCWNYTYSLLKALVQLQKDNALYEEGTGGLTRFAQAVTHNLSVQTNYPQSGQKGDVEQMITHVQEFLAIFEDKTPTK